MEKYSNLKAMQALVKASLQGIFKSPSAIVFTIGFPLIFILVFGFLGNGGRFRITVAAAPDCDTNNALYSILHHVEVIKWRQPTDTAQLHKWLNEGDITAALKISARHKENQPAYKVTVLAANAEADKARQLENILVSVVQNLDPEIRSRTEDLIAVNLVETKAREYKTIDFILPGQLSFSLLASGVFGTAFVFFNLRQTLVLKRYFATPVKREIIVISEGISRMLFQLMGSVVIISIGHYAFDFTLIHGIYTFLQMLLVCAMGLLVFMGFGFIISSIAKSESAIPPISNLVTMPQFLLAGTFFSIDNFPAWLQPLCKALPLTHLNDALRKISYEGASLWEIRTDMLIIVCWGIGLYIIAGRVFKWE
ncbi:MAG: ABC transporter permease [Chitinophagia bacterium]|nr:ABC transporter permease [Chitinophagia bacterium]